MSKLFESLSFTRGPAMENRFMLAPLTNTMSHADGTLSDEEFNWLTMRAKGGFGLTMTCAAYVHPLGQGFPGQLGVFSDDHIPGLTRLAAAIKSHGSVASLQLHHGGMRAEPEVIGERPVCPSNHAETNARAMTLEEVKQLREYFIAAAERAKRAGFDGVEIHGAHGYMICQFLSPSINQRTDAYGGSLDNRARILFEIVAGIRERCGDDFQIGVRLSAEMFDLKLMEVRQVAQQLMSEGQIEFLDMSLWDVFKEPLEEEFQGRSLMSYFTELDRGNTRLGVAGKINDASDAAACLDMGCDFVLLGRAAIINHDFPNLLKENPEFVPPTRPVGEELLIREGASGKFLDYLSIWKDTFTLNRSTS